MIDATSVFPNRKCKKLLDKLKGKGKYTHDYPTPPSTPTPPKKKQPNPQSPKSKSEETPSTSTIEHVPDPSLTKHNSKLDQIAEKYWPLMLIAVVWGLVILFTKVFKKYGILPMNKESGGENKIFELDVE
jgi:hypothetical protein